MGNWYDLWGFRRPIGRLVTLPTERTSPSPSAPSDESYKTLGLRDTDLSSIFNLASFILTLDLPRSTASRCYWKHWSLCLSQGKWLIWGSQAPAWSRQGETTPDRMWIIEYRTEPYSPKHQLMAEWKQDMDEDREWKQCLKRFNGPSPPDGTRPDKICSLQMPSQVELIYCQFPGQVAHCLTLGGD